MLDWLLSPMDATRAHEVGTHLSYHARLMVVAWAVLVPTGILSARFFKVLPKQNWPEQLDNRRWWHVHRACQYTASILMAIALYYVLTAPELNVISGPHAVLGWIVIALVVMQISGGILRGTKGGPTEPNPKVTLHGDHFDMTPRRLIFEAIHKTAGYVAVLLSVVVILTGLWQSNAPRWMALSLIPWWGLVGFVFFALQKRGMAVDTYMAIWGPDPDLPGNTRARRKPARCPKRGKPEP